MLIALERVQLVHDAFVLFLGQMAARLHQDLFVVRDGMLV